jgi:N-[(2S)-2-amino-2-carboxyethyl]-L-glutamate dehydrogenase
LAKYQSFPGNLEHGLDRTAAVLILNSMATGRPKAIMESSIISATRAAASAALAAQVLQSTQPDCVGLIGCGIINFHIADFLRQTCPGIKSVSIFDIESGRAQAFHQRYREAFADTEVSIAGELEAVLERAGVISFATTASTPYVAQLARCSPEAVILNVSLRDLSPQIIVEGDNVVDDVEHVCRAQTSVPLTEQLVGHRGFIRCTLGDILNGICTARVCANKRVVFSPFGLAGCGKTEMEPENTLVSTE